MFKESRFEISHRTKQGELEAVCQPLPILVCVMAHDRLQGGSYGQRIPQDLRGAIPRCQE